MDFNFKKLITKPNLGSKKKSQGVVSFMDGGQVKLGVPGMAPDAGSPTEMDQVGDQERKGRGERGDIKVKVGITDQHFFWGGTKR